MTEQWTCTTCGAPSARNIGTRSYCTAHLTDFYRRNITTETWMWRGAGIGLPIGPINNDGEAPLQCVACDATWTGPTFTDCPWCLEAAARQRRQQAELVLKPPDIDTNDASYQAALLAWIDRLVTAVKADIITRQQAERALRRTHIRVSA